ncbi:MAG TPA: outer membrane beta-barrel protein [Candidatus Sulfotelmatobacter sp.]|nr:outer membrane beta-barrel protein [Candidatus Sulfotelmatobacter sp.]
MSGKRLLLAVILCAAILAKPAVAQDEKNELGGTFGHAFISDQGINGASFFNPVIHSGKGWSFDVEYGRRFLVTPLFAVSGEVVAMYNPDEDLNAGSVTDPVVPANYKQIFVTPAARLNLFPTTAVSPWVSFGIGIGHFSQSSNLAFGGANPGKSTTSATFEGGVGLDVKLTGRVYLRGEARDFWSGHPDFPLAPTGNSRQHNYFVAAGAYWRF